MMSKSAQVAALLAICTLCAMTSATAEAVALQSGRSIDVVGFTDNVVLIADTRNGKPLIADSGPLQIVVPQDKRAARWVRQVTTLEVRQLP